MFETTNQLCMSIYLYLYTISNVTESSRRVYCRGLREETNVYMSSLKFITILHNFRVYCRGFLQKYLEPSLRSRSIHIQSPVPTETQAALTVLRASGSSLSRVWFQLLWVETHLPWYNDPFQNDAGNIRHIFSHIGTGKVSKMPVFCSILMYFRGTCQALWLYFEEVHQLLSTWKTDPWCFFGSVPHLCPSPWRKQHQRPPSVRGERVAIAVCKLANHWILAKIRSQWRIRTRWKHETWP